MSNDLTQDVGLAQTPVLRYSVSALRQQATCSARRYFWRLAKEKLIEVDPSIALVTGSAAHKGIELALKEGADPFKVAADYVQENLFDKFPAEKIDMVKAQERIADMNVCIANYMKHFHNNLLEQLEDPQSSLEVTLEMPWRKGVLKGVIDVIAADGIFADWKGLALDTPLPTPNGWTTMADVRVGDTLFGREGHPCKVIGKSEVSNKKCYRVTFDDKTSIVCDEDHLWYTVSGSKPNSHEVRNVKDIAATLKDKHRIPLASPLDIPRANLAIDPYVLGAWLGDGKHTDGSICGEDDEIFENIESCGYTVLPPQHTVNRTLTRTVKGLRAKLGLEEGLLGAKHIPEEYLRGNYEQRLALLQGLMDTDGTWNPIRKQAIFTSIHLEFAESVEELVHSLGGRARIFKLTKRGFGKEITAYDVAFTPVGFNPFRISRKRDSVVYPATRRSFRRLIIAVDEIDSVPTQCIAVNSPDNTYLCGKQMVPTHNTGKVPKEEMLGTDPQAAVYYYIAKSIGMTPPRVFNYVYLKGKPMTKKPELDEHGGEVRYKTGPRKGQVKEVWDQENNLKFTFPVLQDDDKVKRMMNDYIVPVAVAYENDIMFKNRSDYNCASCEYRTVCPSMTLPERTDYDIISPTSIQEIIDETRAQEAAESQEESPADVPDEDSL